MRLRPEVSSGWSRIRRASSQIMLGHRRGTGKQGMASSFSAGALGISPSVLLFLASLLLPPFSSSLESRFPSCRVALSSLHFSHSPLGAPHVRGRIIHSLRLQGRFFFLHYSILHGPSWPFSDTTLPRGFTIIKYAPYDLTKVRADIQVLRILTTLTA